MLAQGLPSGWFGVDVGDVGQPGSNSFDNGVLTISGAGADIWGAADSLRLVSRSMATNGEVVARVTSVQDTHPFAKAGVMVRQNLGADSPHVILDVRPNGELEFMTRPPGGGATIFIAGASVTLPVYLKVVRLGQDVTGSYSADGQSWTTIGKGTVVGGGALFGFAVTSHDTSKLNTSTFEQAAITALPLPSDWFQNDVGDVGQAGDASYSPEHDVWTVRGAGDDIWGPADAFHYAYQKPSGDAVIQARLNSQFPTDDFAKAGIMMRGLVSGNQPPAPDDPHVILDVRPSGEIEFMSRPTRGAETTFLAGGTTTYPAFLKLERVGNLFKGYVSNDGTTYRLIGSTTANIDAARYAAGLAVTSHNRDALNSAAFQRVSVVWQEGAQPPPPDDVTFYASDFVTAGGVHGSEWFAMTAPSSPERTKLVVPDIGGATVDAPLAAPTEFLELQFQTQEARQYHLWLRLSAENDSKFNDSVWVQFTDATINGAPAYRIGTTDGLLVNLEDCSGCGVSNWGFQDNAWWLDQSAVITLPAGQHSIRIQKREDGVQFDEFVLSPARYLADAPGPPKNATSYVPRPR